VTPSLVDFLRRAIGGHAAAKAVHRSGSSLSLRDTRDVS